MRLNLRLASPAAESSPSTANQPWSRSPCPERVSVEPENGGQCFVDAPHFFGCDVADEVAEALRVNGTDLLGQHAGSFAGNVDLGPERRRSCAD